MDKEIEKKYIKAGFIAKQALEYGASLIIIGANMEEVLDKIEDKIHELGGNIAFPAQISINETAAHDCAYPKDERTFKKDMMCCLDVGVHIDGYVGDTATTIYLGDDDEMLLLKEASKMALDAALKIIKPGVTLSEIGKTIQNEIEDLGFLPIRNLSGHGVSKFKIHTKPSIPNYDTKENTKLKDGDVIAIEPFATDGKGYIYETNAANLFSIINDKKIPRSNYARDLLNLIKEYNNLPFTTRWLYKKLKEGVVNFGLKELLKENIIKSYPPLVEREKGIVSQHEHTVIVKDKPIITTK